jgi:hypothetical protein
MSATAHELDPAELSERLARLEARFGELRGRL